jgi:diguanylate cyclase (GGDEF)-like protein/PAS domain S-box-containing protein
MATKKHCKNAQIPFDAHKGLPGYDSVDVSYSIYGRPRGVQPAVMNRSRRTANTPGPICSLLDSGDVNDKRTEPVVRSAYDPVAEDDTGYLRSARVMMVDDEPTTLDVLRSFLQEAGYRNLMATSEPRRALELMAGERPDVLLLDLMMPEVSGFDIIKAMRSNAGLKHIPIIVLTSYSGAEMKIKALELGATDFLAKPVESSELTLRLKNTLAAKTYLDRLKLALDNSGLALWDFDLRADRIYLSEQWQAMLGGQTRSLVLTRQELEAVISPEDLPQLRTELREVLEGASLHYDVEYRVRTLSGQWIWIRTIGKVVERDTAGRAVRITGTHSDITTRKRTEIELAHQATHDALTGLPNRGLFYDRLERAMIRSRRSKRLMAVMYVDIDRFKSINDTFGHGTGDALLKAFARRLADCMREADTVARMGGDEFTLIVEELTGREMGTRIGEKIVAATRPEFALANRAIAISSCVGVSFYEGEDNVTHEMLIKNADEALYSAKSGGRNTFRVAS